MCYNPIKVKYHHSFNNYRGVLIHPYNPSRMVNCGQCLQCREQYIESWQIRWKEQLKSSMPNSSYMLTLTYNDDNLPHLVTPDGEIKSTLQYSDVQKFIKRLRKKQETICKKLKIDNPSIKYHGSGEYGTNFTKRPHYHILITNLIIPPELIESIWGKGMVDIGTDVTERTINYILKYTLKNVHSTKKPIKLVEKKVTYSIIDPFPTSDYKHSNIADPSYIAQYGYLQYQDPSFVNRTEIALKTVFKYHPKGTKNEYRVAEKSFLSKGIGKSYLTEENVKFHIQNPYSTYDYYDVKKRQVKQRPLPRYYHESIYNPIMKDSAGKNMYDADKKPIRVYNKSDYDHYTTSALYVKQVKQYQVEQKNLNKMLKYYNNDIALMTKNEAEKRRSDKDIAINRRKRIEELQKHANKIKNIQNS